MLPIAINHMTAPRLRYDALIDMAARIGAVGVEFRNDLPGRLFDGDAPATVRGHAGRTGLRILALSEVKAFNDWSEARREEAATLMDIAVAIGAEAVSLIPRNDGHGLGNGERQANLRLALRELAPMLETRGLKGLVEPLGFEQCSLRHKSEAVDAIDGVGGGGVFRLVHDTFHHHLAGGGPLFPAETGIVHVSGVADPTPSLAEMRDPHRGLVDERDRLGNVEQVDALLAAGYAGPVSLEAFSPEVHDLADPEAAIGASFAYIASSLKGMAA